VTAAGQLNGKKGILRQKTAALFTYISVAMIYILSVTETGNGNLRVLRQQRLRHKTAFIHLRTGNKWCISRSFGFHNV